MLKLENITVRYNEGTSLEKVVLDDLSLDIDDNKFVGLIGSNGAGKSTLVKVIAGEVKQNSGKVIISSKNYSNTSVVERAGLISRVFQDPMKGVAPKLTVLENMIFAEKRGKKRGIKLLNIFNKKLREYHAEKLKILDLGLEDKLDWNAELLSGGQRQALSLIMATSAPAKLLILDEHTASLDPKTAEFIMDLTCKIIKENKLTALMITHDMNEVKRCDKMIVMEKGKTRLTN